jgi:hypothetical protein
LKQFCAANLLAHSGAGCRIAIGSGLLDLLTLGFRLGINRLFLLLVFVADALFQNLCPVIGIALDTLALDWGCRRFDARHESVCVVL